MKEGTHLFFVPSTFCERFRDGQYSVVSFLFAVFLLTVPPCPAICKSVGGRRALWSWRHCWRVNTSTGTNTLFPYRVFRDHGDAPFYFLSQLDSHVVPRIGRGNGNRAVG